MIRGAFCWTAWWISIFGYGIHVKTGRPYFSERYGYNVYYPKWEGWRIRFFGPRKAS
jgi:hypothetical protein